MLWHTGFILHQRSYKETSLIIEVFTAEQGKIALVANGARRAKSKWHGILRPFIALSLSWVGKPEKLLTLTQAEMQNKFINLQGVKLLSGLYVNELIIKLVAPFDPHPDLYTCYHNTILDLAEPDANIEPILRKFELKLLAEIGFKLQLLQEVHTKEPVVKEAYYLFDPAQGPIKVENNNYHNKKLNIFKGETLIAIQQQQFDNQTVLFAAKKLMRQVINYYLAGQQLETRKLWL